jgi:mRNA-degrading endonuclease RelE of RelBE toxin-antitoxin system
MQNEPPQVVVSFTPEVKRNLKALSKKYPHIKSDIQPVIDEIQNGNFIGEQIPRMSVTAYKVRIANSDIRKGKRSGYRLIYQIKSRSSVILLTIYSKLDQSDIWDWQIRRILKEHSSV